MSVHKSTKHFTNATFVDIFTAEMSFNSERIGLSFKITLFKGVIILSYYCYIILVKR